MLRGIVIAGSLIVAAAGAGLAVSGLRGPGAYLLVLGIAVLLGTLFERWRYHPSDRPAARWQSTGERFEDPTTGETVEVFFDPATGERRYQKQASAPGDRPGT